MHKQFMAMVHFPIRYIFRGRKLQVILRLIFLTTFLTVTIYALARNIRARSPRQLPTLFPPHRHPSYGHHHRNKWKHPDGHVDIGDSHIGPAIDLTQLLPPPREKAFRRIDKRTYDIDGGRYVFVHLLGTGYEGECRVYMDMANGGRLVVIKTFFAGTRVNPLPPHLLHVFNPRMYKWWWMGGLGGWILWPIRKVFGASQEAWGTVTSWPVEIPATLWYNTDDDGRRLKEAVTNGFVEVVDYFYLENRWFGNNWQLVMPFYEDGTLEDMAKLLSHLGLKPHDVDRVYRRHFLQLLGSIAKMHKGGYCHDDIKSDNIFIKTTNRTTNSLFSSSFPTMTWLVSDLGNVRQIPHVWHLRRPHPARPRLAPNPFHDCRVLDTARALKSYLGFLRQATSLRTRTVDFDREFYRGKKGWSWAYWRWNMYAQEAAMNEEPDDGEVQGGTDVVGELKQVFDLEQERMWDAFLAEAGDEIEEEREVVRVFSIKVAEQVWKMACERNTWRHASWEAKVRGNERPEKPQWLREETWFRDEGWLEGVERPTEPRHVEPVPIPQHMMEEQQRIIKEEESEEVLKEAVDLELDCMALEEQRREFEARLRKERKGKRRTGRQGAGL